MGGTILKQEGLSYVRKMVDHEAGSKPESLPGSSVPPGLSWVPNLTSFSDRFGPEV